MTRFDDAICSECPLNGRIRVPPRAFVDEMGDKPAEYMVIGRDPGRDEEESGVPFVGRSGMLLWKTMKDVGWENHPLLPPQEVYVTNLVKCRTDDRNASPNMMTIDHCMTNYLLDEIKEVKPKGVLLLGKVTADALLGRCSSISGHMKRNPKLLVFDLREEHQTEFYREGRAYLVPTDQALIVPAWVCYHPSWGLRGVNNKERFVNRLRAITIEMKERE